MLGHTSFAVYLRFKFSWASYILFAKSGNFTRQTTMRANIGQTA